MWLHAWNAMHMPGAYGGMGPYMGQGMDATTRDSMLQQLQEHMGSGFSTWMMSGREDYQRIEGAEQIGYYA